MKYNKGYNYAHRKAQRALDRMSDMHDNGANFNELWPVFEPLDQLRYAIPIDDLAQTTINDAMKILHNAAQEDYEDEVIAEYWASR